MKRVIEFVLPLLIVSTYIKAISLSGLASVMLMRRWSMLKPLNIVFLNDYLDTLIISVSTFILTMLLAYTYRSIQTYLLLVLGTLSLILSTLSYLYPSVVLCLLIALYSVLYTSFIERDVRFTKFLRILFSTILLISLLSFLGWVLYFTHGGVNPYREPLPLQDIEAKLLYSLSTYVPIIVIIFLLMPLLIFILKPLTPIESSKPSEVLKRFSKFLKLVEADLNSLYEKRQGKLSTIFFLLGLLTPPLITISLYSENVNPSNMIVGVDILSYVDKINSILSKSSSSLEIFVNLMKTDRPLSLLIVYYSSKLLNIPIKVISMYAPCFLAPLLTVTTFFLAGKIFKNRLYASLTSFMFSLGSYTTASLYGGFLANWLGLSLTFTSITILLKALEKRSLKILATSIILSILSHLSHPIPWSFTTMVTVVYGLSLSFKKDKDWDELKLIWMYALINIFFDIIKTRIIGFSGAGLVAQSIISRELSIENLLTFWQINVFMFYFHVGGAFNFPPTYILAILGMILFLQSRSLETNYLKIWIMVGIPLYLLGPDYFQARTLQNTPIDFFASTGAVIVFYYLSRRDKISANLFLLLILLTYLNNILRFAANLPF